MEERIKNLVKEAIKNLGTQEIDFTIEHPEDLKNGDYSTNVALVASRELKKSPRELADKIKDELTGNLPEEIEKVEVAGAGFVNFYLSRKFFSGSIEEILNNKDFAHNNLHKGKVVMIEYTDPNPFKPFHIGHLMTNTIGESIARILELSGAEVSRANYQGDVGLHVAKAIWGLLKDEKLQDNLLELSLQSENVGKAYTEGALAYESSDEAEKEINQINKKIYDESDEKINKIYDWGLEVTMKAFEDLYRTLGTKFDFYFLESHVAPLGEKLVRENIGTIFEDSDGAVVFKAEKRDPKLHTRVFITKDGLPTYEAKEIGLIEDKFKNKPNLDLSIVVTANEQADYMKVVTKAISLVLPEHGKKMLHITHGMMKFASGKMSSRKGNVVTGETLIRDTKALVSEKMKDREVSDEEKDKISSVVGVAALKYSILKQSIGSDIVYDFEKSISFEGDSGPYLQYSYARANSVLEKAQKENILPDPHLEAAPKETIEVEKLLYRFPEIVHRAASEYEPHYIANFLIELARSYNSFYGNNIIVKKGDPTSPYKVALSYAFTFVMKKGLHLLGIAAPEKM